MRERESAKTQERDIWDIRFLDCDLRESECLKLSGGLGKSDKMVVDWEERYVVYVVSWTHAKLRRCRTRQTDWCLSVSIVVLLVVDRIVVLLDRHGWKSMEVVLFPGDRSVITPSAASPPYYAP